MGKEDLIRRQDAIMAIVMELDDIDHVPQWVFDRLEDAINKVPSAQPETTLESEIDYLYSIGWMQEHDKALTESAQPENGSWVYGVDPDTGERDLYAWTCSECGGKYPWQPKFCPNCGVKMNLVKTITDGETTYIQDNDKQGWKGV